MHTQVQKDADALLRTLREQPTSIADIDPYAGTGQCPRVGSKAELSVWCLGAGAELSREPIAEGQPGHLLQTAINSVLGGVLGDQQRDELDEVSCKWLRDLSGS